MTLLADFHTLVAGQPVVAGIAAAAVGGSLLWSLKALPVKVWEGLRDLASVTLVVEGRDDLYRYLNLWLSRSGAAARSQRLCVQEEYDYQAGGWGWKLTLGHGWHLVWTAGRPLFVNRSVEKSGELAHLLGQGANQRLWLVSPGRSQAAIRKVVAEAERIYNGDGLVRVNFWHAGHYVLADRRSPRPLETVFLPAAQKARLVADAAAFTGARETYARRGTPYRRGYLLEGPPGTGKTSLIFAMAGLLGRAVYVINLASVASDNDLMAAFNEVGSDGMVVIEDIDAAEISRERPRAEPVTAVPGGVPVPGGPAQGPRPTLTLSGLLNAVDGVAAREGRMLFVTSNHVGKLDPALLRSGRIDLRERIAPLERAEAWEMFRAFRPDAAPFEFDRMVAALPIAAAELQNLLQRADAEDLADAEPEAEAA